MNVLLSLVILGTAVYVNAEKHSLFYIYTAFSKPVALPGIHEFTAMGLLDGKMIDYYDSENQKKVPKQTWMKEKLEKEYWEKGTLSRKSKEQWFKVNIDILMKRMRQNDTVTHVLQWMHGCEGYGEDGQSLKFTNGMDRYNYDGKDFLSFDDSHETWVAPVTAAEETKRKWDEVTVLREYTKGYLEKECMQWLSKFLTYGEQQLKNATKPEVYVFAKATKEEANVILTCMATGFYPKDINVNFRKNGLKINGKEGVTNSGIRPNEDETFQIKYQVKISKSDDSVYTCEVRHYATNVNIEMKWDGTVKDSESEETGSGVGPIVGGVVGLLLVAAGVGVVVILFRKKRRGDIVRHPTLLPVQQQSEPSVPSEQETLTGKNESDENGSDSGVSGSRPDSPEGSEQSV